MGDRPVALCSESERWRAQAALQLTLAAMTDSKVVVLDRADLLDASNRQGLVRALERVTGAQLKWRYCYALLATLTGMHRGNRYVSRVE